MAIAAVSLTLFLTGCDDDSGTNDDGAAVILPLVTDNIWHGTYTIYDSEGTPSAPVYYSFRIDDDTTVEVLGDDQIWFKMERTLGTYSYVADDLYRNQANGLWMWEKYDESGTEPNLWAKYKATAGDIYLTGSESADSAAVVSISASVSVPAGNFTCYRYKIVSHSLTGRNEEYWWLAADHGFIKYQEYYKPEGDPQYLQSEWELDSLDLN